MEGLSASPPGRSPSALARFPEFVRAPAPITGIVKAAEGAPIPAIKAIAALGNRGDLKAPAAPVSNFLDFSFLDGVEVIADNTT